VSGSTTRPSSTRTGGTTLHHRVLTPWLARLSGLDAFWAFAVVTIPIALSVVVADDWMIRMLAYAAVVLSRSPPSVTGGRRVPR
jgi:hypothetical protein